MVKKKSSAPRKRKPVLQDHKKVGSTLVSPFKVGMNLTELRYVHDLVPEICWIGLANQALGYQGGVALVATVAKAAKSLLKTNQAVNFALTSSYEALSDAEKLSLLELLRRDHTLPLLQAALAPLNALFSSSPLAFLGLPSDPPDRPTQLTRLRRCVGDLINKHAQPAGVAQAAVMYVRGITGGLYFLEGVETPDLDAIVNSPQSDAGLRAAAMVRAAVLQEILPVDEPRRSWPMDFWNQALFIDECYFSGASDD
jgi:hypothetical protein